MAAMRGAEALSLVRDALENSADRGDLEDCFGTGTTRRKAIAVDRALERLSDGVASDGTAGYVAVEHQGYGPVFFRARPGCARSALASVLGVSAGGFRRIYQHHTSGPDGAGTYHVGYVGAGGRYWLIYGLEGARFARKVTL